MPKYINNEYDIEKAFRAIEDELIASMMRNLKSHRAEETKEGYNWSMWQVEQLKSLEKYKKDNAVKFQSDFSNINASISVMLSEARAAGGTEQEQKILRQIRNGFKAANTSEPDVQAAFFRLNTRKLNALAKATTNDFTKAEHAMLRMSNDKYRQIIYNAQVYANTGAATYEKAVDMATRDFLSAGINCVEYKNGSRHTVKEYARMAIQTANKRAYLAGEGEKRKEWGISTVIVNKRGNACPKCLPFCGKVLIDDVWSGGKPDGKHMLMSTAIEMGLYHPRCKDIHTTYFEGITEGGAKYSKEELRKIEEDYRAEQKQQYAERQAERFDRLAKYSLDEDNKKIYKSRFEVWNDTANLLFESRGERGEQKQERIGTNEVDLDKLKDVSFSRKFSRLTENTAVNDSIRNYARAMLTHRNGTDGEDLYIVDSLTGKRLFSKVDGTNELGVELSDDENNAIRDMKQKIAIHNHPSNILPTGSDFVTAGYRNYDYGIVVTHDLRVFQYKVGSEPFRSEYMDKKVDKYMSKPYTMNIEDAQKKALDEMSKEFGISWKEIQ